MQELGKLDNSFWTRFHALLEKDQEWPNYYLFKFIVPRASFDDLRSVFGRNDVTVRASAKGRYVSLTARLHMKSSAEVIAIYEAAGKVEGVISL